MLRKRSSKTKTAKRYKAYAGGRKNVAGNTGGRAVRSTTNNLLVIVPLLLLGTGILWLGMAVIFGGLGGHKFSLISKLDFLQNSNLSYYESHEAMLKAQKIYRKRKKERAEVAYNEATGRGTGVSYYAGAKSGRIIYEEEAELMQLNDELQAAREDQTKKIPRENAEGEAVQNENLELSSNFLSRDEVLKLLELKEVKLRARIAEEQIRSDSDADIENAENEQEEEIQSEEVRQQLATKPNNSVRPENVENKVDELADNLVIASEVDIKFLDNKCGTFNDSFKRTPVVFRKGSTAIKGASLDELDNLIMIARKCGDIRLSILPTFDGQEEDAVVGRDLLERRNAEVKYYLLQRRIPKEMIAMHTNVN